MAKTSYTETLLHAWEQTYHKGHLTFWILIALKESPKSLEEIRSFIDLYGQSVVSYDDQSIYRALRKYEEIEMLQYELRDGDRGPQRKYYGLTALGASVLQKFIERNILLFSQKKLHALLLK
jgi:PadR family transcriptional regulator, regulatory protein PadR